MKKIVFILSVLLNIGLIYFFVFKGSTVASSDTRVAMKLSKSNRDFVLAEMRGFLESVQLINNGIVTNDVSKVIEGGGNLEVL